MDRIGCCCIHCVISLNGGWFTIMVVFIGYVMRLQLHSLAPTRRSCSLRACVYAHRKRRKVVDGLVVAWCAAWFAPPHVTHHTRTHTPHHTTHHHHTLHLPHAHLSHRTSPSLSFLFFTTPLTPKEEGKERRSDEWHCLYAMYVPV